MGAAPRGPCRSPRYSPFPEHGASISSPLPPPLHHAGLAKSRASFQASLPQRKAPWRTNCVYFRLPSPGAPSEGEGEGPEGEGGGGRAGGERQRSVGGGAAPCEPRQRHLSSAAQRRAEPLRCRPGRAGPSGRRGGLSCGGPGAPAVPLPSCQAGFYGNIDRIKVPCNSVINGVSLVSKMKCGAVKLFIWKVILRNLTSDTWSYIKPAS